MSQYLTEDQLRVFMEVIKSAKELTPVIFTTQPTDLELRIRRAVMELLGNASEIEGFSDPENKGQCGITNTNSTYPEPSTEAKLWVIDRIAQFICDTEGEGTFRKLIYDYLNLDYADAYDAGAMCITSSISSDNFHEYPAGRGNRTKHDIR